MAARNPSYSEALSSCFQRDCNTAKNDSFVMSVRPSVYLSVCNNSAPFGCFSHKTCYSSIFSEICRKKNRSINMWQEQRVHIYEGPFERKTQSAGKSPRGVLFLHDNAPVHQRVQPRRTRPTWSSSVLITHPNPQIWPLDWKIQLRGRHFSSDTEVIAAEETCLDRQKLWFFLSGLQNLAQRAKKFI
jgi:hypothetical protein